MLEKILEEIEFEFDRRINNQPKIIAGLSNDMYRYGHGKSLEAYQQGKLLAKNIIRKHMNDGWIPVEDDLPEESGYYRVTVKSMETGNITEETAWFAHVDDYDIDESEWRECYEFGKVIAWRELEPYRPEKGAEEC